MKDTIINPWFFYLINTGYALKGWLFIAVILGILALILVGISIGMSKKDVEYLRNKENDCIESGYLQRTLEDCKRDMVGELETFEFSKRVFKIIGVGTLITALVTISIPSKDTAYQMLVASQLTYTNVDKLTEGGKEAVDYFFDKVEEIANGDDDDSSEDSDDAENTEER